MKLIKTTDGKTLNRVSRWVRVLQNYHPSKRNRLWDYARDENGYGPHQKRFDPSTASLSFFRWNGRNWALEQFFSTSGIMGLPAPIMFENEDGKLSYISGYDSENYFNPILIEVDACCEYVRIYEEVQ